ncbi:alpha/beta fold hydrolase [Nocardia sp. NPDC051756]|uniref:esterase/lipase family protein n=1 Tax=Nocardia sp. NPDC051756 TaxID=3154751 RepID=UPI00341F39F1
MTYWHNVNDIPLLHMLLSNSPDSPLPPDAVDVILQMDRFSIATNFHLDATHDSWRTSMIGDARDLGRLRNSVVALALAIAGLAITPIGAATPQAYAAPGGAGFSFERGDGPIQQTWFEAQALSLAQPQTQPMGANDPACRPTPARPFPIVLVPGLIETSYAVYSRMAPALIADGACVFTFTSGYQYPGVPLAQTSSPYVFAATLSRFVDAVLEQTGAQKVDLLGYSQASIIGFYYIKHGGGAVNVHHYIGFDGTPWGTDNFGLSDEIDQRPLYPLAPFRESYDPNGPFVQEAIAGGLTVPSVSYTVIRERFVPLIAANGGEVHGPNVTMIRMEDVCAEDYSGHTGFPYNDMAIRLVRNAFDPENAQQPVCHLTLPQPPF